MRVGSDASLREGVLPLGVAPAHGDSAGSTRMTAAAQQHRLTLVPSAGVAEVPGAAEEAKMSRQSAAPALQARRCTLGRAVAPKKEWERRRVRLCRDSQQLVLAWPGRLRSWTEAAAMGDGGSVAGGRSCSRVERKRVDGFNKSWFS